MLKENVLSRPLTLVIRLGTHMIYTKYAQYFVFFRHSLAALLSSNVKFKYRIYTLAINCPQMKTFVFQEKSLPTTYQSDKFY